MLLGPVESQDVAPASLDAIVLMDVLEHLGDPAATLRHCLGLLRPEGVFMVQTPRYREGKTLAQMEADSDAFVRMLKPDQHLYLFSKSSVERLFRSLGVEHVNFEKAIFSAYDMALVASRKDLAAIPEREEIAYLESRALMRLPWRFWILKSGARS